MADRYCFIVASMDARVDALNRCVKHIKKTRYCNSDVFLYFQGEKRDEIEDPGFFKHICYDKRARGVFTPRYELIKNYSKDYDFTIIIDDDLFMYPDTSYEACMDFLDKNPKAGCVSLTNFLGKTSGDIVCVSDKMEYCNVEGGLVLPKRSIGIILDYFADKEDDYTEDMFWLLLYVKGYDLYRDYSSKALHRYDYKGRNKEVTGYTKMRREMAYKPILQEFFDDTELIIDRDRTDMLVRATKSLKHINANGRRERKRNRG